MARFAHFRLLSLAGLTLASGLLLAHALAETPAQPASQPAATPPKIVVNDEIALAFFQKYEPDVYQQMMVLKSQDKDKYTALMHDFYKEVGRLLDLQCKDEHLFNMTMEDRRVGFASLQLARDIKAGNYTGAQLEKANADLAALLSKQFDVRQQIRQATLDEQKARLEELQRAYDNLLGQFSDRQKSRDDLIKQRISDLMKQNPKVEW